MGQPWSQEEDLYLLEQMACDPTGTGPIPLDPPPHTSWRLIARRMRDHFRRGGRQPREYTAWNVCKRWCDVLMPGLEERQRRGQRQRRCDGEGEGAVAALVGGLVLRCEFGLEGLLTVEERARFGLGEEREAEAEAEAQAEAM